MAKAQAVAMALLSAWVAGTLLMWFVAAGNFSAVDRVLGGSNAQLQQSVEALGHDQARVVLRHLASEINRAYFRAWGWAQVALGAVLLVVLLRQTPRDTASVILVGAMFVVVVVLLSVITPEITTLGRGLDFVPRNPPPPEMSRFRVLHGLYTGLDGAKLLAGLFLLARWSIVR